MMIHGDGQHTRRFLYAGDAADAFDTILHKGTIGQVYNVGSYDEISNLQLCSKLLDLFDIPESEKAKWIEHVEDRPFNDHRYAVDAAKLGQLGWTQKTSFAEGLKITVDWYRDFPNWWGDISNILTAFPVVEGNAVMSEEKVANNESGVLANGKDSIPEKQIPQHTKATG
jgi:dTDP-D-glucose 4,6-dehydratase